MIAEFTFLIWFLALCVPVYWVIPASWGQTRQAFLSGISVVLLWKLSPFILVVVAGFAALLAGFAALARSGLNKTQYKRLSWIVFLPLVLVEVVPTEMLQAGLLGPRAIEVASLTGFALLGLSYSAIRCFIMTREIIDSRPMTVFQAATTFLFLGSFIAGPISGSVPFSNAASHLTLRDMVIGLARIGWGAALFLVLREGVQNIDLPAYLGAASDGTTAAWLMTYQALLVLYLDFAGYSECAIGMGLLFGIKLPENFRYPFLARSMQEFWQRWHLSLGAFISTYLFKPLVRSYGNPVLAVFVAFVLVGLWHKFALTYLVWGIGHGAALALQMHYRRKAAQSPRPARNVVVQAGGAVFGWWFTMTYVAVLSGFATASDFSAAVAYILRLAGAG